MIQDKIVGKILLILLCLFPVATALAVWLSPLSFVPIPWPDDPAFYFPAKDLFTWPPRWVMLPQAPFEPTYRIFNFNTMPLYPILIGIGRWIGIDGSFGIKFWPLMSWALSGSILLYGLRRAGLPAWVCFFLAAAFCFDPEMRWGAVVVRPESLIGCIGVAIVLGMTLGFPQQLKPKGLWDPIAALLALSAYAHFNAIHLVVPVVIAFALKPKRLIEIGLKTLLYLVPWLITVAIHFPLFIEQMNTQWTRLAFANPWFQNPVFAIDGMFHSMGSPTGWNPALFWVGIGLWLLVATAFLIGLALPLIRLAIQKFSTKKEPVEVPNTFSMAPAAGWVLSSVWLWYSKPEVWFVYYIHAALWTFLGLLLLKLFRMNLGKPAAVLVVLMNTASILFLMTNIQQVSAMSKGESWNWKTYAEFVDCIDSRLNELEARLKRTTALRVWCPTYPDVTIELYRRHPAREYTRINDFNEKNHLALAHANEVDAIVITETFQTIERNVSGPMKEHPQILSAWLNWNGFLLNGMANDSNWKKDRYLCQRGRWQAFILSDNLSDSDSLPIKTGN